MDGTWLTNWEPVIIPGVTEPEPTILPLKPGWRRFLRRLCLLPPYSDAELRMRLQPSYERWREHYDFLSARWQLAWKAGDDETLDTAQADLREHHQRLCDLSYFEQQIKRDWNYRGRAEPG